MTLKIVQRLNSLCFLIVVRCVNLDWLEVHAYEPVDKPRNADYFRAAGFIVHEREYGTRVYHEMFTLDSIDGQPFIEVRRNPKSAGVIGIHQINECHIRLHNRTCYYDNAAGIMAEFLDRYGYDFQRISRVDVCMDFERFDKGDLPQKFVERYLKHRYAKINQGRIHSHGEDQWDGQTWNSLSWGSPKSMVGTKLYNKSLQLAEVKDKPYIRWAWFQSGLVDDPINCTKRSSNGSTYHPDIWRVEFSVRSSVKRWFVVEQDGKPRDYRSLRNTLDVWAGRERLYTMFASLARHYFHFKKYKAGQRKDRCPDKILFDFNDVPQFYKVDKVPSVTPQSTELQRLMRKLRNYREHKYDHTLIQAIDTIMKAIQDDHINSDAFGIFTAAEIEAMRQTIHLKTRGNNTDAAVLLSELQKSLTRQQSLFIDQ